METFEALAVTTAEVAEDIGIVELCFVRLHMLQSFWRPGKGAETEKAKPHLAYDEVNKEAEFHYIFVIPPSSSLLGIILEKKALEWACRQGLVRKPLQATNPHESN